MISIKSILIPLSLVLGLHCHSSCQANKYKLTDFFAENENLDRDVQKIFDGLSLEERASQMIITAAGKYGKPHDEVKELVKGKMVGGVLLLNGTREGFTQLVKELNSISKQSNSVPQIFSADAEPSLINNKIKGTTPVVKTSEIRSAAESEQAAATISNDLLNIGIHQNYAPVIDISQSNEAIGNRSFGSDPLEVLSLAMTFVETSMEMNIVPTVKHFPGHGNVKGDTHEKLVFIDGELTELNNYIPFIDANVSSIMVAHLAIKNNKKYDTKGLPATCSRIIVTDLLRNEMQFKGLIITDAMNMGALNDFGNAPLMAAEAGCDLILMPNDVKKLNAELAKKLGEKTMMRNQLETSVKRVLRLKLCLGMI